MANEAICQRLPLLGDILVLLFPPGFEVCAKLEPEHEEMTGGHVLLPSLWVQSKIQNQILKTEQIHTVTDPSIRIEVYNYY